MKKINHWRLLAAVILLVGLTVPSVSAWAAPSFAPAATVNPTSIDFGYQAINSYSLPQTVTVANNVTDDLVIYSVSRSGEFLVSENTCASATLQTGESCTFKVIFTPITVAVKTGSIYVYSNSASSPNIVTLSGIGGKQLLKAGGFDFLSSGPLPWRPGSPSYTFRSLRDCTVFLSTPCSVRFSGTWLNTEKSLSQAVYAGKQGLANDKYYIGLSSRARNVPAGGKYKVEVIFYDTFDHYIMTQTFGFTHGTHNFETVGMTVTVPVNHNRMIFRIVFQNTSGTAWFDDAYMMEVPQ